MFTTIYKKDKYHFWGGRDSNATCGASLINAQVRILGDNGRDKPLPDPPKEQMCEKCFHWLIKEEYPLKEHSHRETYRHYE